MSTQLSIGSLFSGYGGLDLAVERAFNARTVWQCEWEDAPSAVLARHWPDVPNHRDVTAVDWAELPPVDIITGGFPCQDVSLAGRRAGMTEGTRSNLWGAMRTAIETIRPTHVVAENVRGLLSAKADSACDLESEPGLLGGGDRVALRGLGRVLGDLADLGYDAQWHGLRASDVGAPHHRFRVFILATRRDVADRDRIGALRPWPPGDESRRTEPANRRDHAPHPAGLRRHEGRAEHARQERRPHAPLGSCTDWGVYAGAIRRWEALTRPAPAHSEPNSRGGMSLSPAFAEWMMGLPAGWVTDTPGITRALQLKALGNGVVPQQAEAALTHMLNRQETP